MKTSSYFLTLTLSLSLLTPFATNVKAATYTEPNFESPISIRLGYTAFQKTSYSFTINGNYSISGKNSLLLTSGTYTVKNSSGTIQLLKDNSIIYSGTTITLFPLNYDRNNCIKLGSYCFLGDITFRLKGNNVLPVNTLSQEDYLLGVVSSEMSNDWGKYGGFEALKAQAITARTYSYGDVGKEIDNGQSYQVYNGYNSSYGYVEDAVDATRKQIITYNGASINNNAVFSSSNGGTVLSKINSWGTASWNNISYLSRITDPYDQRSGSSNTNWTFSINKNQINLSGLDLTRPENWWNSVFENSTDSSKISSLKSFIKRYLTTYANYDLKIVTIDTLDFTDHNDNPTSSTQLNGHIKISFLAYNPATKTYVKNTDGTIKVLTFDKTTRTYDYYLYNAFGSGVLKSPNIKTSTSNTSQYVITGGGWGHGIGLSQWGAYQRSKEGQKAQQIVSFYYPGTAITSFVPGTNTNNNNTSTSPSKGGSFATANMAINLRDIKSWSGNVITVISKGATMEILDTSSDWYRVSYAGKYGYVHKDYITAQQSIPDQSPTPSVVSPEIQIKNTTNTQSTFHGEYTINQKAIVSVRLTGPNGYNKLTFLNTLDSGSYAFGGPISSAPPGTYTVTVTATAGDKSVSKTATFVKKESPSITVTDIDSTNSTFSGYYSVDQDSKVAIHLTGQGVNKFIYSQDVKAGQYKFGGPILDSFPNGLYTITIEADNGIDKTLQTKTFNINRGLPTTINLNTFSFSNAVYYGTYTIDKDSLVSILLKGPGLQKLTYYQQLSSGSYAYAGNISSFPKGNYTVTITTKNQYGITNTASKSFTYGTSAAINAYRVVSGDTLWSISRKTNTSVDTLMKLNNLSSSVVKVGQTLKTR
ncbi:SpoIID/LytB domain-containing protein [Bacillus mexicanus]|uniref:SpoIID/LytB domain-containing protein n=1 Tax=Bacillus mexicanus TaxID=2834415 RepID=UPI003D1A44E7